MKKIKLFGVTAIASAMMFSSCTKEIETSSMALDLTKSATIKVHFFAELDYSSQGVELVPDGTSVLIRIANSNFNGSASGNWTTTQTVTLGKIEVVVPVTDAGVNVEIIPVEFFHDQIQPYGSISSTINKKFRMTASAVEAAVKTGEIRTRDVIYTDLGATVEFEETISRKFTLNADMDATEAGMEFVPTGTTVTLYTSGWTINVNAGSEGAIDVNIPVNEEVFIRFEAIKRVLNDESQPISVKYRYDSSLGTFTETSPVRQTINCGSGQLWQ